LFFVGFHNLGDYAKIYLVAHEEGHKEVDVQMLQLADDLKLPIDAVTETFGILARRGAGKTYAAAVLAEELIKVGAPVVVLDPVGAWWGLRASADALGPGLPVVIAGGEHGDVPLEPTGGHIIADLVVDDPRPLILDLSDFQSNAAQDRFVADFAERLYRRKAHHRSPLHLIFDEADSFAPQRPMPGQARMLGAIEALVRRGRQRGIGATFITQRSAVLNKNVLTQIEVLIVLQLTAPQDRAAIEEWVRGHGTREQCDRLLQSLASLQRGQAWFWSPARFDLFQKVQIRKRETFDSSKTPTVGEALIQPRALAPVDFARLRERLAASVEPSGQNDPCQLRDHITRLEKELRARSEQTVVRPVQIPVFIGDEVEKLEQTAAHLTALGKQLLDQAEEICAVLRDRPLPVPQPNPVSKKREVSGEGVSRRGPKKQAEVSSQAPSSNRESEMEIKSSRSREKILGVLAQYPQGRSKQQIAVLARYSVRGGSFNAALSTLKKAGYIKGVPDLYTITPSGKSLAGPVEPLPRGEALRNHWKSQLNTCEAAILDALAKRHPQPTSRQQIADLTSYEASGGSFNAALSKLRALELIIGKKEVALNAALAD